MHALIEARELDRALEQAWIWYAAAPDDLLALVALGEAATAKGHHGLAARAFGSIIDLHPARADLRRFAGGRLEALGDRGRSLAIDTYRKARVQRPDHPSSHRLLAFALLRDGHPAKAFDVLAAAVQRRYPAGRFAAGVRILQEDLGIVGAAWINAEPKRAPQIHHRLAGLGATLATEPTLRFVLTWETDANDVDLHVFDDSGGHAYYEKPRLPSGGHLYADVTNGYGPECFAIPGRGQAFPYRIAVHYYQRGPMGYGMGKVQVVHHDGAGNVQIDDRPFVAMRQDAMIDLGEVATPVGL